jgi:hypothetical protein
LFAIPSLSALLAVSIFGASIAVAEPAAVDAVDRVKDGTQLTLGENATLVVDEFVYDPQESREVEMLFAHLKRILGLGKLRLRGPSGAKDEFLLAATARNLRKLAKLIPLPAPIFAV